MDQRERLGVPLEPFLAALAGLRADIWTALPAIVQSYNVEAGTVEVQPAIQGQIKDRQGVWSSVNLPVCTDVPVLFPGAGPFALTFPIAAGDEGLLVFAARSIDAFWQQGGIQPPTEPRMHNLSDGIFLPGRLSQPKKLADVSATAVQLRSEDGNTLIEIQPGGNVRIKATTVVVDGSLEVSGEITARAGSDFPVGVATHFHSGVTVGGGNTQPPIGGT